MAGHRINGATVAKIPTRYLEGDNNYKWFQVRTSAYTTDLRRKLAQQELACDLVHLYDAFNC